MDMRTQRRCFLVGETCSFLSLLPFSRRLKEERFSSPVHLLCGVLLFIRLGQRRSRGFVEYMVGGKDDLPGEGGQ